jgi:2'-5' RNA ligase
MRLFVRVDLDGLADAIAEVQKPLSELSGLQLTDPTQAHITMQFLGEDDHDIEALVAALERAVEGADVRTAETDDRGFTTTFEGVGAFPSAEYIRVVWLGVGRGASELIALHRRIEAETTALGYDATDHDFTPHVTLARMDDATSKGSVQSFLETTDSEVGPLRVEDLRLTESALTTEGPEYRTVARIEI